MPDLLRSTPSQLLAHLRNLDLDQRGKLIVQDIVPQIEERLKIPPAHVMISATHTHSASSALGQDRFKHVLISVKRLCGAAQISNRR